MRRAAPLALLAALAACAAGGTDGAGGRPPVRPAMLAASFAAAEGGLGQARVSTQSDEVLVLEPDGRVTTMHLDSPGGRTVLAAMAPALDFAGAVVDPPADPEGQRRAFRDRALAAFAARGGPALPDWPGGTVADPAAFRGAAVEDLGDGVARVTALLAPGTAADLAFAYAACALAGWAQGGATPFARHVRTVQDRADGALRIDAAWLLSEDRPVGLAVLAARETLQDCASRGIPPA